MKYVYVLVYSYDNKTISDFMFFQSAQDAINWKKDMIANNECGNPISAYGVKRLDQHSTFIQAPQEIHEQFN